MNRIALLLVAGAAAFAAGIAAGSAYAGDRYQVKGSVGVSADLSAPWLLQLQKAPAANAAAQQRLMLKKQRAMLLQNYRSGVALAKPQRKLAALMPGAPAPTNYVPRSAQQSEKLGRQVDSQWMPQVVEYDTGEKPGTIVINTNERFLYLVMANGKARRYGVGVGKPGFEWAGTHKVTRKAEWPSWTPPAEMVVRVREKEGRILPARMEGGPENPLGARAMYLGNTLYRIHGTNQPWTIGGAVSSGCIRMRNEDVVDLYERVKIGTRVRVI
jgi:lipoprotein-anchoring transpeptidase ErfK/SrfK